MSDNGQQQPQSPRSVLVIEFIAPGSAEFSLKLDSVSPAQIIAAAAWLDWFARRSFDRNADKAEANRIQVPGVVIDPTSLRSH